MKILLVAASKHEVQTLLDQLAWTNNSDTYSFKGHQLEILISGVGMVSTVFSLAQKLVIDDYDLAINIGISGAFDHDIELGEVVEVISDQFSEEGAEDGSQFLSLADLKLRDPNEFPFTENKLRAKNNLSELKLRKVHGVTVNTVHGNEASIQTINSRLNPQVESMEGAAFVYACLQKNVACVQIRAISNYVEKRNRSAWKIDLALDNLARQTMTILNQM